MTAILPTSITANRQTRQLLVVWSDGHSSAYGFRLLRDACPCATCKGGHENMGMLPENEVFTRCDEETPATRLSKVEAVGNYAITFAWEDGHHDGIYNWQYLRTICPCITCRA
ncbi:MAG: gamma-butyrobetaine hydroxylase-like domain-containing protein [Chloroflexota bacterium]